MRRNCLQETSSVVKYSLLHSDILSESFELLSSALLQYDSSCAIEISLYLSRIRLASPGLRCYTVFDEIEEMTPVRYSIY